MSSIEELLPLRNHAVYTLVGQISQHVGLKPDLIQLALFLSLSAGALRMPINLELWSDAPEIELQIMRRILNLKEGLRAEVDTHTEFRKREHKKFKTEGERGVLVVLVRSDHSLFHDATLYLTGVDFSPSVWHAFHSAARQAPTHSALRIVASKVTRDLDQYPAAFASPSCGNELSPLATILDALPRQSHFSCPFTESYRGTVTPELMLVFERMMRTMTALRLAVGGSPEPQFKIELADYLAARALLIGLPLARADHLMSPKAVEIAGGLYERLRAKPGIELPGQSDAGATWFTRKEACQCGDCAYNTAKKLLSELETEGILQTTIAENNRQRGKQQHYRFVDGVKPPFVVKNPFDRLPELPVT